MPHTFVAFDLETTGLSPDRDAIIEVGAVKYRHGERIAEFSTLVNPGRPIPKEIQQLTGITNQDVARQPSLRDVSSDIIRFTGTLPIVGHNVSFDLGFMHAQGLLIENTGWDTWELATIVSPRLPSYGLGSLAAHFNLSLTSHHRALDDASATGELFLRLCALVADLPKPILIEIVRLAQHSHWLLGEIFEVALRHAGGGRVLANDLPLDQLAPGSPLLRLARFADPLVPREPPEPIDVTHLTAMLAPGGSFSRAFPGYEFRPPQLAVLEAVADAFNQGHHLMAEAGTGTGKSLAYLLPAVAFATKNQTRVVVSTNTINLQDQLFKKDLPDLQRILRDPPDGERPIEFRAALLKGRSNYLCPRRFLALKRRTVLSPEEVRGLARILVWLPTTETGDQNELSLPSPGDRFVWSQVSASNEGCSLDRCQREMGGRCFYYKARRQAEAAHVIIVNHSLLMADAATEYRVLPEYHHVIIDEAHHLEDAVTDQLSFRADEYSVSQLINSLYPSGGGGSGGQSGLFFDIMTCIRQSLPAELMSPFQQQTIRLQSDADTVHTRLSDFWDVTNQVIQGLRPDDNSGDYGIRERITTGTRSQPAWVELEVSWESLSAAMETLLKRMRTFQEGIDDLTTGGFESKCLENLAEELEGASRQLGELRGNLEAWVMRPTENGIYWAELGGADRRFRRVSLCSAPLHVGPLVETHILFRNETVILTSATLRTASSFDYVRDRLSAFDADTTAVGSPFNYKENTLLYLPSDLPEPTASGYQTAVEQSMIALVRAIGGRTLALFTSYAQLRRTAQAITPPLASAGIEVLSQGSGSPRHQLLETFKNSENKILLGTRSFWEGIDVVGPALSALVLVRLPFAVPSDPIVAARSETFDDPFYQYSVPDAILRFRQGFGRLIRSKSDRGVVVVLDKRVQTKNYGQLFLDSLPECTVQRAPLIGLPQAAQRWLEAGPPLGG